MRFSLAIVAIVLLATSACSAGADGDDGTTRVVAAFYPLAWAATQVGGGLVEVGDLTPSGVEPHDLELRAGQVRDLSDADLVAYVGSGFQPAIEDVADELDEGQRFDALEAAGVSLEQADDEVDPHVWLDPRAMADIVDAMATRLAELDPSDAERFRANAAGVRDELADLDDDFERGLSDCARRDIVTSHSAFGYLAARYGLEQVSVAGIDPESEPTPGRLAEVADFVTDEGVTTIFFEELAPKDVAETLARETGATVSVLTPLETEPDHGDYLDAMRANLSALRKGLDCE